VSIASRRSRIIKNSKTAFLIAAVIVPIVAIFAFVDAYPQPAEYYLFSDTRKIFGVPNFWNVASNALFMVFGFAGLILLGANARLAILSRLKPACYILFFGVLLTAFGSAWFHLAPNNDTLFWDRLPMTIAFMPMFTLVFGEHVSTKWARRILWPLVLVGSFSVIYWEYTESIDAGDLRLYGLVQFLPLVLISIILLTYRSVFSTTRFYWHAIALYGLAKVFEQLDGQIYALGAIISGHSLKHVAASLVPLVLIKGFRDRQLIDP